MTFDAGRGSFSAARPPLGRPVLLFAAAAAWVWLPQVSGTSSDLRGVCAVSPTVAWASGTKGVFLRTLDGGSSWRADRVAGAETLDFRDVEAFDAANAVLMSAGEGASSRVYRTSDGGAHWTLELENPDPKGFFDALAFWDRRRGLVLGDPVGGKFVLFTTEDGAASWRRIEPSGLPDALPGEGAFAASGTCLVTQAGGRAWFGTGGGGRSRVFRSDDFGRTWRAAETPLPADTASSGVFSLAFRDARHGLAAGGDYRKPRGTGLACLARTDDGGATWTSVSSGPTLDRFLSAVAFVSGSSPPAFVATGAEISAWSGDDGATWTATEEGYNALSFVGETGWAAGPAGRLARFPPVLTSSRRGH